MVIRKEDGLENWFSLWYFPWLFPDLSSLLKIPCLFPDWKMPSYFSRFCSTIGKAASAGHSVAIIFYFSHTGFIWFAQERRWNEKWEQNATYPMRSFPMRIRTWNGLFENYCQNWNMKPKSDFVSTFNVDDVKQKVKGCKYIFQTSLILK